MAFLPAYLTPELCPCHRWSLPQMSTCGNMPCGLHIRKSLLFTKCKHCLIATAMSSGVLCDKCFPRTSGRDQSSEAAGFSTWPSGDKKGGQVRHRRRELQRANSIIWGHGDLGIRDSSRENGNPKKRWEGARDKLPLWVCSQPGSWWTEWSSLLFPMPKSRKKGLGLDSPSLFV